MDHGIYITMSEPIRKTYTFLWDDSTMASEIDRVIIEGVKSRLPVFIYIPVDVVGVQLDASRLETPLDTSIKNESAVEDLIVKEVLNEIKIASKPIILGDVLTIRHGGRELARELVDLTNFQSFSTPLSKGIIDETQSSYGGVYNGTGRFICVCNLFRCNTDIHLVSFPGVVEAVHGSDLVLNLGPLLSDSNTGGFTRDIKDSNLIQLGHAFIQIKEKKYDGVHFLPILKRLVEELKKDPKSYNLPRQQEPQLEPPVLNNSTSGEIKQSFVWQRLGRFLEPNDILLTESGTAQFGMPDSTFPPNVRYITQIFWSSIGYTVGGCLGALVAQKELNLPGRVVLIVGEGSLQMTVQEIGSYIRYGFKPVIFVINNNGYSIERAINGPKQAYNDVSMLWDHQKMLSFFGVGVQSKSYKCKTVEELEAVLEDDEFKHGDHIRLCEIVMDQFDYPWRLSTQIGHFRSRAKAMTGKF